MDSQKYNDLINEIELDNIFLSNLNCTRESNIKPGPIKVEYNPEFKYISSTDTGFNCIALFSIIGVIKDKTAFKINAEFTLIYKVNKQDLLNEELINEFVKRNVPVNSWPYGREIISSVTTRMGLPPLVLKTFKINFR